MARSKRHFPAWLKVFIALLWPPLMLFTKRERIGNENLPETGGYVIAGNHLSYVDPFTFAHWMVDAGIPPRFLGKDTLFTIPVAGWLLYRLRQIPVYRGTNDASKALAPAIDEVRSGGVIGIYPEGTMTRDPDCWPMTGRTGAVRIAVEGGVPVVPVAQWGPNEIMWPYRKGAHWFPRKTMRVRVGKPIDFSYLGESPSEEQLAEATDVLMDAITELLVEIRGERPTGPRIDVHTLEKPKTHHKPEED